MIIQKPLPLQPNIGNIKLCEITTFYTSERSANLMSPPYYKIYKISVFYILSTL